MLASRESGADCNRVCAPGVEPDARGCCPSAPAAGAAPSPAACTDGKEKNDDTAGHCCWSGQVWDKGKCNGIPRACPKGFTVDRAREACKPNECPSGMGRPANARTECCWPGQLWSKVNSACVGAPRCPKNFELRGDTCGDLERERREAEQRAQQAREQAEREKREAAERAEREKREAAERAEREKREAEERAEREKREAEERRKAQLVEEEKKRREEREARFAEAKRKAEENRDTAAKPLGFGIAFGVASAPFIGLSAWENGRIHAGGFSTGADIKSAAAQGKALGIAGAVFGVTGGALFVVGVAMTAANLEPKESDVARATTPLRATISIGPSGAGVRGSF